LHLALEPQIARVHGLEYHGACDNGGEYHGSRVTRPQERHAADRGTIGAKASDQPEAQGGPEDCWSGVLIPRYVPNRDRIETQLTYHAEERDESQHICELAIQTGSQIARHPGPYENTHDHSHRLVGEQPAGVMNDGEQIRSTLEASAQKSRG